MAPQLRTTPSRSSALAASSSSDTLSPDGGPKGSSSASRERSPSVVNRKEALDLATESNENVFLFVPNLIGYARVVLAGFALAVMPYHPKACTALYFVSSILDVADGHAARMLNQSSKFGAVLDMVTDRCATACLLCFLAMSYPSWALLFQFLITLDFSSHYMHMYSSLVTGSSSHKIVSPEASRILYLYYNNRTVLFLFCFMNETFFVALYLVHFYNSPLGIFPAHLFSSLLSPLTPFLADSKTYLALVAAADQGLRDLSLPMIVTLVCAPVCAGKNIINGVQFWKASKTLVGIDLAERAAARQGRRLDLDK